MQASRVRTAISPEEHQAGAEPRQRPVVFRVYLWTVSEETSNVK